MAQRLDHQASVTLVAVTCGCLARGWPHLIADCGLGSLRPTKMAHHNISCSSSDSSSAWLNLQRDFEEARAALLSKCDKPKEAWQRLLKALNNHSNVACYPEPWKWAIPSQLPYTMSHCVAFIVSNYKYHQTSRRKILCRLSGLVSQFYLHCGEQQDTSIRVALSKQANDSGVLQALKILYFEVCLGFAAARDPPCSTPAAEAGAPQQHDALSATLELAYTHLQLFQAIHSI